MAGALFLISVIICSLIFSGASIDKDDEGHWVLRIGPESALAGVDVDYTCNGADDDVQFQSAVDALPTEGGEVSFLTASGSYDFNATVSRAIDDITISGLGESSYITGNGVMSLFDAGSQSGWTFRHLKVDAGGIDVSGATNWLFEDVWIGSTYYAWYASSSRQVDHDDLSGLADDDHTQYLLVDGTRAMTGPLNLDLVGSASGQIVRTGDSNASLAFKGSSVSGAQISIQGRDHSGGGQIRFHVTNTAKDGMQQSLTMEAGDTAISKFYGDIYFQGAAAEAFVIKRYEEDDAYLSLQGGNSYSSYINLFGKDHAYGGELRAYVTNTAGNGTTMALRLNNGDTPDIHGYSSVYLNASGSESRAVRIYGTDAGSLYFQGGTNTGASQIYLYGKDHASDAGEVHILTSNTAGDGTTTALQLDKGDDPLATFGGRIHTSPDGANNGHAIEFASGTSYNADWIIRNQADTLTFYEETGGTIGLQLAEAGGAVTTSGSSLVFDRGAGEGATIYVDNDDGYLKLKGGLNHGAYIDLIGKNHALDGRLQMYVPNSAESASTLALILSKGDSPEMTIFGDISMNGASANMIDRSVDNSYIHLEGGIVGANKSARLMIYGWNGGGNGGDIVFHVPNAAHTSHVEALRINGVTANPSITWSSTTRWASQMVFSTQSALERDVDNSFLQLHGGQTSGASHYIYGKDAGGNGGGHDFYVTNTAGDGTLNAFQIQEGDEPRLVHPAGSSWSNLIMADSGTLKGMSSDSIMYIKGGNNTKYNGMFKLYGGEHATYPGAVDILTANADSSNEVLAARFTRGATPAMYTYGNMFLAADGVSIQKTGDDDKISIYGGASYPCIVSIYGKDHATGPGRFSVGVPNAAANAVIGAFYITGMTDTPTITVPSTSRWNGNLQFTSADPTIRSAVDNDNLNLEGGATFGARIQLNGKDHTNDGYMYFQVPDAAETAMVNVLTFSGGTDNPAITLSSAARWGSTIYTTNDNFLRHADDASAVYLQGGANGYGGQVAIYGSGAASTPGDVALDVWNGATGTIRALLLDGGTGAATFGDRIESGGELYMPSATTIRVNAQDSFLPLNGGSTSKYSGIIYLYGHDHSGKGGDIEFISGNATGGSYSTVMSIEGATDSPTVEVNYPLNVDGAVDLGSTLTIGSTMVSETGSSLKRSVDNSYVFITGGSTLNAGGIFLYGQSAANSGDIFLNVPNSSGLGSVNAISIDGMSDDPEINVQGDIDLNQEIIKDTGTVNKTMFIPSTAYATGSGSLGYYGYDLVDGGQTWVTWGFQMPEDYVSGASLDLVWYEDSGGNATGNMYVDWTIDYGAEGQAWNVHTDTTGYETLAHSGSAEDINESGVTATYSSLAVGDYVMLKLERNGGNAADTIGADVWARGILLSYVGEQIDDS